MKPPTDIEFGARYCLARTRAARLIFPLCAFLCGVGGLSAEDSPPAAPASPALAGQNGDAPKATPFESATDELSYALGMNAAAQLEKHSLGVNPASYYQGLRDALSGRSTLLSPQRALEVVSAKQKELADSARADKSRAKQLSAQENKKAGEAFLALNRTRPGVTTLPSGLQYKILRQGFGRRPASNDVVVCAFQGAFVDGRVFDSSERQGKPTVLPLNKTLRGWREALELMPAGSKWQIVVPPSLAYGARSSRRGGIPPNSVLVFELELQSVQERPVASQPTVAHSETDADDLDSNSEPRAAN